MVQHSDSGNNLHALRWLEVLNSALRERETGNVAGCLTLLELGRVAFPNQLDQYGHPAFHKEILRTHLISRRWDLADSFLQRQDVSHRDKWYLLLFARAYSEIGNEEQAKHWWTKTLRDYPNGATEYRRWCRMHGRQEIVTPHRTTSEVVCLDLDIARQFIRMGRYDISPTIARLFSNGLIFSMETTSDSLIKLIDRAEKRICSDDVPRSIPKIVHRIWLTNDVEPVEPPQEYISAIIIDVKLHFSREWLHIFWVQNESYIQHAKKSLTEANINFEIRQILGDDETIDNIIDLFIQARKFAFAADVARLKVLDRHGGLYVDLGITFNAAVDVVFEAYDYVFLLWHNLSFQNSLIAVTPGNPLTRSMLNIIHRPGIIPRYLMGSSLDGNADLSIISGPMIMLLFLLNFSKGVNVGFVISNRGLILHQSQQSWYSTDDGVNGKLGGVVASREVPTLVREDLWRDKEPFLFNLSEIL